MVWSSTGTELLRFCRERRKEKEAASTSPTIGLDTNSGTGTQQLFETRTLDGRIVRIMANLSRKKVPWVSAKLKAEAGPAAKLSPQPSDQPKPSVASDSCQTQRETTSRNLNSKSNLAPPPAAPRHPRPSVGLTVWHL